MTVMILITLRTEKLLLLDTMVQLRLFLPDDMLFTVHVVVAVILLLIVCVFEILLYLQCSTLFILVFLCFLVDEFLIISSVVILTGMFPKDGGDREYETQMELGEVVTSEDKLLVFPNFLQHKVNIIYVVCTLKPFWCGDEHIMNHLMPLRLCCLFLLLFLLNISSRPLVFRSPRLS